MKATRRRRCALEIVLFVLPLLGCAFSVFVQATPTSDRIFNASPAIEIVSACKQSDAYRWTTKFDGNSPDDVDNDDDDDDDKDGDDAAGLSAELPLHHTAPAIRSCFASLLLVQLHVLSAPARESHALRAPPQ